MSQASDRVRGTVRSTLVVRPSHRQGHKVLRSTAVMPCHDALEETGSHDICTCRQMVNNCEVQEERFALKTIPGLPTCITTPEHRWSSSTSGRDDPLMTLELFVDDLHQRTTLQTELPAKEIAPRQSQLTSTLVIHLRDVVQEVFLMWQQNTLIQKLCASTSAQRLWVQRQRCIRQTSQCCRIEDPPTHLI